MKHFRPLLLAATFLTLFASCMSENLQKENRQTVVEKKGILTKSISETDTLSLKVFIQSDPSMIMSSHLIFADDSCFLCITREEALALGVTEDIYDKFENIAKQHNK